MRETDEMKKILKAKKFESFWQCFDYVRLIGRSDIEALRISLDLFNEKHIFDNVAVMVLDYAAEFRAYDAPHVISSGRKCFIISFKPKKEKTLKNLISFYTNIWIMHNGSHPEMEKLLNAIKFSQVDTLVYSYLWNLYVIKYPPPQLDINDKPMYPLERRKI